MCGIAGFNWADSRLIKKMTREIAHRGPDDEGWYVGKHMSLGSRRLSIIDISQKGNQPMFNEQKDIAVVFNGEIWNYKSIKEELEKKGHKFKSNSDTEVIAHGYEEHGENIVGLLDGMFAFALWDSKKKKLILARDKIGKKPLYYYFNDNKLIFASEIKAILLHEIKREINESCLSDYLSLRFSPDAITMFKGINKLPAGSFAKYQSGKLEIEIYYSLPKFNARYSADEEKADKLIAQAIQKRLIADVPIGVFLSGGLDSSTLVAYISKYKKNIRTFSVGFSSKVDETKYARLVAREFKTKHTEIRLDEDILKYLPEVVYFFDEPLADPAALPTYLLCKEVSKHVKVAISGEGGDEVFGGYDNFNYIPELKLIYKIPFLLRKSLLSRLFYFISKFYSYPKKHLFLAISSVLKQKTIKQGFKELFYFPFDENERKSIFNKAKNKDIFDSYLKSNKLDEGAQNYYFNEWLPNDLLMKADKMSMAHSLEVRTPFLDSYLIEYFSGLGYKDKHKRNLFRKVVSGKLPSQIMKKKKQGFTLPLFEWFSDKKILGRIYPFMEKLKERGIFNDEYIDSIFKSPYIFKNEHRLWTLLNFEIWCEIYLDKISYTEIKL